jgi:hypothetical protein
VLLMLMLKTGHFFFPDGNNAASRKDMSSLGFFFFSCAHGRADALRLCRRESGCQAPPTCFATFGVWPRTLPARASDPCTFPIFRRNTRAQCWFCKSATSVTVPRARSLALSALLGHVAVE